MRSNRSGKYIVTALTALVAVLGVAADTAWAADANLYVQFTTTNPGGNYSGNVHVVWLTTTSGGFVATIGTTTTDNKRAVWANSQADELDEWYLNNLPTADRTADIAARTGATQSSYQTYTFNWNWRDTDGATIPDGTYQLHFLVTNSNTSTVRNHATVNNVIKGTSAWSYGPTTQNGYNNISLNFTPAGLGVMALPVTNVGSASATLNGEVTAIDPGGSNPTVYIYYGDNDAGTTASNWDHAINLGTSGVGPFSADVIDLIPATSYYYRCRVVTTSPGKDIWSGLISFTTTQPEFAHINVLSSTINFGQVPVNGSLDIGVAVQNSGKLPLELTSLEFVGLESDAYSLVPPPALPLVIDALSGPSWINQDIGGVGISGNVEYSGNTITINASGVDIWGSSDEFHFLYLPLTGNGTITARVDSLENTDPWAKAGVMMRETLAAGSKNVFMAMSYSDGATFQWRTGTGGTTASQHDNTWAAPYWVRLVRSGNTFTAYRSPDGQTWSQWSSPQTFTMNNTLYIGLAVTSHNDGTLCTAVFSNVSTSVPPPTPDEETLTVRFSPTSVQDYKYTKLAIGSNDPGQVAYINLQGVGGPDAALGTRQVGGVGGPAKAVAKYGDNILLGQGAMLVLLDVSNPASPSMINQIRLEGVIEAITVQGDTAYAALGSKGFAIVDLKDFMPLSGAVTVETGGFAADIDSEGSALCIADGIMGAHLYNISVPLEPVIKNDYETDGAVSSMDISGGSLYILDESEGIHVFGLDDTPVQKEAVAHWRLNETSGIAASDASSNGHNGTLINMDDTDWISGKMGNALAFDGVDDYVESMGYTGVLGTTSRTCTAWIKTASAQQGNILSWGNTVAGQKWMFRVESDGTLGVGIWEGSIKTATTVNDGQWHHVAAVLNDDGSPDVSKIRFYIDGALQDTTAAGNTQIINTVGLQNVIIGAVFYSGVLLAPFDGLIDDVRIYDAALTSDEISGILTQKKYRGVEFGTRILHSGADIYAADSFGNLFIMDAGDEIQVQSEMLLQIGSIADVEVQDGYAYVIGQGGLEVLDISNPASPMSVFVDPGFAGSDIAVEGSAAYLAGGSGGLKILDISSPAAVTLLGSYALMSSVSGVAGGDTLDDVYAVGNEQALAGYDLSVSAAPVVNDTYESLFHAEDIQIEGQYAFVAAGLAGLEVFDLSNPAGTPAALATARFASAVSVNGSTAMVCDSNDVYIVDVTSPMSPLLVGTMSVLGWGSDVAVGSTHGYVAEGGRGITILDFSNAQAVGSYPVAGLAYGVAVDGDDLYVACGTAGLAILDVSDPASPSLIAEYDLPGVIVDVAKVGNRICVADALFGISVLDVSNPAAPVLYASAATRSPAFHISSTGSRVLVADKEGGLAVLGLTGWPKNTLGDLSNDYQVSLDDLVLLATQWVSVESGLDALSANLNYYDTIVNMQDYSVLSQYWQARYDNTQGLVAHWKFDETTGFYAMDSTSNNYDGTLVDMDNSNWVLGIKDNALLFDGVNDKVQIKGYKGITGTASRTCTAWIKTITTQQGNILSWGNAVVGQKWMFRIESNGALGVGVWDGYIKTTATVNNGQWHHVAAVLNDDGSPAVNEIRLYIDGVLQSSVPSNTRAIGTVASQDVTIGALEYSATVALPYFPGLIDDVRIYNRALTEQEIQGLSQ